MLISQSFRSCLLCNSKLPLQHHLQITTFQNLLFLLQQVVNSPIPCDHAAVQERGWFSAQPDGEAADELGGVEGKFAEGVC